MARLEAQDSLLNGLQRDRDALALTPLEPRERLKVLLQRSLDSRRRIDRLFWLQAAADSLRARPEDQRSALWRAAYSRIHSTFRIPYADRAAAVHFLATKVVQLDRLHHPSWPLDENPDHNRPALHRHPCDFCSVVRPSTIRRPVETFRLTRLILVWLQMPHTCTEPDNRRFPAFLPLTPPPVPCASPIFSS